MARQTRCALYRRPDARHEYDAGSGWCIYGCGHRADGRIIYLKTGHELRPGRTDYSPPEQPATPTTYTPPLDLGDI